MSRLVSLLVVVGCAASADTPPTFSPPPSTTTNTKQDRSVTVSERSRAYVKTQTIAPEASAPVVRAPARVAFRDGAVSNVNIPIGGRIIAVHVKTGDRVKAGDPLLTLNSSEAAAARASLAVARAELEAAQQEVARQERMAAAGVGIESEMVAARTKLKHAEVELARANTTVALIGNGGGSAIVLKAPIDGIVISRRATVGAVAEPAGEPLVEIGDPTALWVIADLFERDLAQVHEGAEVEVEVSVLDKPIVGRVASVGSALTGNLRTAPVYVVLDGKPEGLRAGMFARATIKAPAGSAIVLPSEAVLIKDGKRYVVFVQRQDGKFVPTDVKIGRSIEGKVQILSGLTAGQQVVVSGALLLDNSSQQLL